jgi:Mrp family chromosome partitioning ATPase
MRELLDRLRSEFDFVLIDTAPTLHLADARVVGRMSDGVVLVVCAGKTPRAAALAVAAQFASDGTPVMGAVLNNWDGRRAGYGSYPYYAAAKPGSGPEVKSF